MKQDGVYRLCLFSKVELQKLTAWQYQVCEGQRSGISNADSKTNKVESHTGFVKTSGTSTVTAQSMQHSEFVGGANDNDKVQASLLTKELLDTVPLYLPFQAYHRTNSEGSSYFNSISNSSNNSNNSNGSNRDDDR